MPPRKKRKSFASTQKPHREAQTHSAHSRAVVSGCNGPITRSRRSTIHCLPLEVLGQILILALPTDKELYDDRSSERQKLINAPLVFCAVCSSWRFLAFSTPRLWNRVHIHVSYHMNEAQAKRQAADLVQWIERSRSLLITLHISGDIVIPRNGNREALVISVIKDHAARWESLYFRHSRPLPSSFHFDGWHSLRRLYTSYFHRASCANHTIPWAHLTHLRIGQYMPYQDAAMIFMKCPKLVYLSILVNPPSIGQSTTDPIVLGDLVTFYLRTVSTGGLETLVGWISLPSLRELSIGAISTRVIQPLLGFLTRSFCSLDKLEIRGSCLTSGDYLNVLTHSSCDSLTSLMLRPSFPDEGWPVDKELLQKLTLHRNDTVCRHLTFLAIDLCIPTSSFSAVLNMAKSRIKSAAGQVPEEPALQYLQLHVRNLKKRMAELDKVGRRSGMEMEYSRKRAGLKSLCVSVWFRRQGFREPPELFWS